AVSPRRHGAPGRHHAPQAREPVSRRGAARERAAPRGSRVLSRLRSRGAPTGRHAVTLRVTLHGAAARLVSDHDYGHDGSGCPAKIIPHPYTEFHSRERAHRATELFSDT